MNEKLHVLKRACGQTAVHLAAAVGRRSRFLLRDLGNARGEEENDPMWSKKLLALVNAPGDPEQPQYPAIRCMFPANQPIPDLLRHGMQPAKDLTSDRGGKCQHWIGWNLVACPVEVHVLARYIDDSLARIPKGAGASVFLGVAKELHVDHTNHLRRHLLGEIPLFVVSESCGSLLSPDLPQCVASTDEPLVKLAASSLIFCPFVQLVQEVRGSPELVMDAHFLIEAFVETIWEA